MRVVCSEYAGLTLLHIYACSIMLLVNKYIKLFSSYSSSNYFLVQFCLFLAVVHPRNIVGHGRMGTTL